MGIRHELRFPVGTVTLVIGMSMSLKRQVRFATGQPCFNWICVHYKWISVILTSYVIGIWFLQPKILLGVYSKLNGSDVYKHLKYFLDCLQLELVCFVVGDKIRNWSKTDQWPVCYRIGSPICRNIRIQKWNWDLETGNCINHVCQSRYLCT